MLLGRLLIGTTTAKQSVADAIMLNGGIVTLFGPPPVFQFRSRNECLL